MQRRDLRCHRHVCVGADRADSKFERARWSTAHGHRHAIAINSGSNRYRHSARQRLTRRRSAADNQHGRSFTDSDAISDRHARADDQHGRAVTRAHAVTPSSLQGRRSRLPLSPSLERETNERAAERQRRMGRRKFLARIGSGIVGAALAHNGRASQTQLS